MAYPFIGFAFLAYVFGTVRWSLWKVSQTDEAPQAVLASTSWWYGFSGIFALASIAIEEWGRTLWPLSLAPMLAAALCESAAIGIFCAWFLRRTGHRTIAKVTFGKAAWLCLDGNKKLVSLRLDYLNGGDIGIRAARSGTELLWGALQLSALLLAAIFLLKAVSGS